MRKRRTLLMLTVCALTILPVGMLSLPGFQPAPALAGPPPGFYKFEASNPQLGIAAFEILAYLDRDGNFGATGNPPAMLNEGPGTPAIGMWKADASNAVQIKAITKLYRFLSANVGKDIILEPHGKATIEGTLLPQKDVKNSFAGDIKVRIYDALGTLIQEFPLHLRGAKKKFEDVLQD